jgi:BlaI family penicillinase repressor
MEKYMLCESDYRFMSVVWENEPVSSGALVVLCAKKLGWKKSTTYTVLRKLCEKRLLKNDSSVVTSLAPRDEVRASESAYFVDRTFGGSLPGFLTSFLGGRTISEREAEELKRLIDAHRGRED